MKEMGGVIVAAVLVVATVSEGATLTAFLTRTAPGRPTFGPVDMSVQHPTMEACYTTL
jgi:hypothetical protein